MLVTFTTDAHANITMFGEDALGMLRMMGHSATVPGAILAADVPEALERLASAVGASDRTPVAASSADADEQPVSTAHRGQPLISLLAAAVHEGSDVMWERSSGLTF